MKPIRLSEYAIQAIESIISNGYEAVVKTEKGKPVVIETQRKVKYKSQD